MYRDEFGRSVSISGDHLVSGAHNKYDSGGAYIFWGDQTKSLSHIEISGPSVQEDDSTNWFGCTAHYTDGSSFDVTNSASWTVTCPDYARFGGNGKLTTLTVDAEVDCDVSATFKSVKETMPIIIRNSWKEAKLIAGDGARWDRFGVSVSTSGETAIVSSNSNENNRMAVGSVYIFQRMEGAWTQTAKLHPSARADRSSFGASIALSDAFAIVGTRGDDGAEIQTGSAFIYTLPDKGHTKPGLRGPLAK